MSSNNPNVARRHHTVPQFYLRGFASEDLVSTIRLPGTERFTQSVSDATVNKDFYTLAGHEDGPDAIEKLLSEVEGTAAAVFSKIEAGTWPLDREDRGTLGYFTALQSARVPIQRRNANHLAAQIMKLQIGAEGRVGLRKRLREKGVNVTDELVDQMWAQATRPEGPPIKRPTAAHIGQMIEFAEESLKYFVGRPWALIRFERFSLITSDSPVSLVPEPENHAWEGVGLLSAWGITFPLTRKIGLLMSSPRAFIETEIAVERVHHGEADNLQTGTADLQQFFNETTVANASEWLFHHPDDERFVPSNLPSPSQTSIRMSSEDFEFSGEPWFRSKQRDADS